MTRDPVPDHDLALTGSDEDPWWRYHSCDGRNANQLLREAYASAARHP